MFVLSSSMDWYLEVRIQTRLLIPETKDIKILQKLTSICHDVHNTCIAHGRNIKTRYFGCNSKRIDILSDWIECNHPSRNTSSLLCSKSWKIEDWRSLFWEIIHFDHHQRYHWDTITIGLEGMINRVQKLNNSQLEVPQQSCREVQHVKFS